MRPVRHALPHIVGNPVWFACSMSAGAPDAGAVRMTAGARTAAASRPAVAVMTCDKAMPFRRGSRQELGKCQTLPVVIPGLKL
jgi:hypothetical protein